MSPTTQINPWDPKVTGIVAGVRLDAIQSKATQIGLLSQAIGDIKKQVHEAGSGKGICASLACWWLKGQKNGKPLLKQLLVPGAAVDQSLLSTITKEFQAIAKNGEKDYFIKELRAVGLTHGGSTSAYVTSEDTPLGEWICDGNGSLSAIFIRAGTDHAMAVDMQKYIFFDPNVGEFAFGNAENLKAFLNKMLPKFDGDVPAWRYMKREGMKFREIERHSFS